MKYYAGEICECNREKEIIINFLINRQFLICEWIMRIFWNWLKNQFYESQKAAQTIHKKMEQVLEM